MMGKHVIKVADSKYPCYQTMGASLMYKRETGSEASTVAGGDISGLVTLLWCLTACACDADGVDFPYRDDLQGFANRLSPDSFASWCELIVAEASADGEKKSKRR